MDQQPIKDKEGVKVGEQGVRLQQKVKFPSKWVEKYFIENQKKIRTMNAYQKIKVKQIGRTHS